MALAQVCPVIVRRTTGARPATTLAPVGKGVWWPPTSSAGAGEGPDIPSITTQAETYQNNPLLTMYSPI